MGHTPRSVLVTGGNRGIGLAIAQRLNLNRGVSESDRVTTRVARLHGEATAGDVRAVRAVANALSESGIDHDIAWSPGFLPGELHVDDARPSAYTHLVFACGPVHGWQIRGLHERAGTVGGWVDLSSSGSGTTLILSVPLDTVDETDDAAHLDMPSRPPPGPDDYDPTSWGGL